jgi:polysaccharide lyase-like protein
MTTDTSKITQAATTLGNEIASAIQSLDAAIAADGGGGGGNGGGGGGGGAATGGQITNFTSTPQTDFQIDGIGYSVLTCGNSYSIQSPDDHTLRFEIHPGDRAWFDGSSNLDRSQVECRAHMALNEPWKIACKVMIEEGPESSADWLLFFEQHNSDGELPGGGGTSPPVYLELPGADKFQFTILYTNPGEPASAWKKKVLWTAPQKFKRGQWYEIEIEAKVSQTDGYARMKLDGQQVADYSGPLGYNCSTYWCMGPYRGTRPETFAVQLRNFTASWAAS